MVKLIKEIRQIDNLVEHRNEGSRIVEGYALLFNSKSKLINNQFYEIIEPQALTNDMLNNFDVMATYNHHINLIFCRSYFQKGDLKLIVDSKGLKFSFKMPKNDFGDELLNKIKTNSVKCSFAFSITNPANEVWTKEGKYYLRTIKGFDVIYDISIVDNPAYAQTYVNTRGLDVCKLEHNILLKKEIELKKYYMELKNKYLKK